MAITASFLLAATPLFTSREAPISFSSSSRSSYPPLCASPARALRCHAIASAATVVQPPAVSRVSTVVDVDLGDRSYPIYIGPGLVDEPQLLQSLIRAGMCQRVLVVTNTTVAPLYLEKVTWALTHNNPNVTVESIILPDGEKYKDSDTLMKVFDKAMESRLDRRCTFVALGGGVIGDLCGLRLLRCTEVDSSVGGKNAINHPLSKILIGTGEVVMKVAVVRDAAFFEWQEKNMTALLARDPSALTYAIKRSLENKAKVVARDEQEHGLRAKLNLGHTFGHAIETALGHGTWFHGEAVAAGTVMAADMSYRLGWIDESVKIRTIDILEQAKLPIAAPKCMTVEKFKNLMAMDKKAADGVMRLVLLKGPLGGCVFTGEYDRKALDETLRALCDN